MADIFLKKYHGMLAPADERAEEIIAQMQHAQVIKVSYHFPRNYGNHKRFFAFLKVTFDLQDNFDNMTHYRKWLTMKAGQYDVVAAPNGKTMFLPKSIAFDKMDETEFRQVFSDCIDVFIDHWKHKISRSELERVVEFA